MTIKLQRVMLNNVWTIKFLPRDPNTPPFYKKFLNMTEQQVRRASAEVEQITNSCWVSMINTDTGDAK